jgi:hypothetical protein
MGSNVSDPKDPKGTPPPSGIGAPPPPTSRAVLPSRLAGNVRRERDLTTFGHTANGERETIPQFGADMSRTGSHRHHTTVAYDAPDAASSESTLPGVGLDEIIAREALLAEKAIGLLRKLCRELEVRHSAGLGHGGLTPRHIRMVPDEDGDLVLLEASEVSGSEIYEARYEAPELSGSVKTRTVQPARADVYAIGIIFFEMLVGDPPFVAADPAEIRRKHRTAAAPSPRQANPDTDLAPPVELVLQRALKKRPGDRPIGAQALIAEVMAANADDDRGTVHFSIETAGYLKEILEAKTQSEKTKQQVEEEKRKLIDQKRIAEGETQAAEEARRAADLAAASSRAAQLATEKRRRTMRVAIIIAVLFMIGAGGAGAWFLTRDPEIVTKTNTVTKTVKETVTKTEVQVVEREVPVYIEATPTVAPAIEDDKPRRPRPRSKPREEEPVAKPPTKKPTDGPAVF